MVLLLKDNHVGSYNGRSFLSLHVTIKGIGAIVRNIDIFRLVITCATAWAQIISMLHKWCHQNKKLRTCPEINKNKTKTITKAACSLIFAGSNIPKNLQTSMTPVALNSFIGTAVIPLTVTNAPNFAQNSWNPGNIMTVTLKTMTTQWQWQGLRHEDKCDGVCRTMNARWWQWCDDDDNSGITIATWRWQHNNTSHSETKEMEWVLFWNKHCFENADDSIRIPYRLISYNSTVTSFDGMQTKS